MRATWRSGLEAGQVVVVLQLTAKAFADLPGVPLAINLAKTDEARQLIPDGARSERLRAPVLPANDAREAEGHPLQVGSRHTWYFLIAA